MGFSEQELRSIIQQTVESIIGGNAGSGQGAYIKGGV